MADPNIVRDQVKGMSLNPMRGQELRTVAEAIENLNAWMGISARERTSLFASVKEMAERLDSLERKVTTLERR